MEKGFVLWFTGLPGAGKTTLGRKIYEILKEKGYKVEMLDGDEVRKWLSPEAGFTKEDRERHLRRVIYVSKLLARNGVIVIATFVSPYRAIREEARKNIKDFVEVFVKCSVDTAIKRDPKGLYKRALKGEIKNMTGIDDPYEEPINPEIVVDTERLSVEESIDLILGKLREMGYLESL
ncbi:MAG: adenylyl-sulfate kinase [Candidatus Njordarchaeia archaeon]